MHTAIFILSFIVVYLLFTCLRLARAITTLRGEIESCKWDNARTHQHTMHLMTQIDAIKNQIT